MNEWNEWMNDITWHGKELTIKRNESHEWMNYCAWMKLIDEMKWLKWNALINDRLHCWLSWNEIKQKTLHEFIHEQRHRMNN